MEQAHHQLVRLTLLAMHYTCQKLPLLLGFWRGFYLNNPKATEQNSILRSWHVWLVHKCFPSKGSPHLPAYCSPKLLPRFVRPEEEELQCIVVSTLGGMWKLFQGLAKLKDTCSLHFCKCFEIPYCKSKHCHLLTGLISY